MASHDLLFFTTEGPMSDWVLRLTPNVFIFLSGIS